MGIPSFYSWLVERYPMCVLEVVEEKAVVVGGVLLPIDTSRPNPNGFEFDNLYLDMNGVIHPCFHPEGLPGPKTYDEVFEAVFRYIDRIFSIVRPRKLLFLAIDGIAPRAKMNQQRTRRFKTAKEAADEASQTATLTSFESEEAKSPLLEQPKKLDSNVITPGTEFMDLMSSALRYYIHLRMNEDLGWQGIKVILSDATVPGEGEHKIMSYIRLQRNLPGFDPNTRHCLYGLDADLIMLALASHEIHFTILREDVRWAKKRQKTLRKKKRKKRNSEKMEVPSRNLEPYILELKFQFFNIWVLREYLELDMRIPNSTVKTDLECLIDDFVLMCCFVGNDFLPNLPALEIPEGAINLLMMIYKDEFVQRGGYLTNSFEVNLERVEHLLQSVGTHEHKVINRREKSLQLKREKRKLVADSSKPLCIEPNTWSEGSRSSLEPITTPVCQDPENSKSGKKICSQGFSDIKLVTDSSKPQCIEPNAWSEGSRSSLEPRTTPVCQDPENLTCMKIHNNSINSASSGTVTVVDKSKIGEGLKQKYFAQKFEAKTKEEHERIKRHAIYTPNMGEYTCRVVVSASDYKVSKYIEGVCWVMRYYYEGVCSWQWFYPYHYAPFASDFCAIDKLEVHFTLGEPFKPFEQLMAVLPAASAHALPMSYRKLMTDVSSPILDFYPTDFEVDMEGKRFPWQAICKLPFIVESRLLAEIAKVEHTLTDEEKRRNSTGMHVLFVRISHPLGEKIDSFCKLMSNHPKLLKGEEEHKIDPKLSGRMNGYIYISDEPWWPLEICSPMEGMKMIAKNQVISVLYKYPLSHSHISRLPEGVLLPGKSAREEDILSIRLLWRKKFKRKKSTAARLLIPDRRVRLKFESGPRLPKVTRQVVGGYNLKEQSTVPSLVISERHASPKFESGHHLPEVTGQVAGGYNLKKQSADPSLIIRERHARPKFESGPYLPEVTGQVVGEYNLKKRAETVARRKLGDHVINRKVGSKEIWSEASDVSNYNPDKLDGFITKEPRKDDDNGGLDALLIKEIEKPRNVKCCSKKGKLCESDGVANNIFVNSGSCILSQQSEGHGDHTAAAGLEEIKTEVKSKNRRKRYKKRKPISADTVINSSVEKVETCLHKEENKGDGDHAGADGLPEIGTKVVSLEKKRQSKRRKLSEGDGVPNCSVPNSSFEKLDGFITKEPRKDDDNGGLDALLIKEVEKPRNVKCCSKKGKLCESDGVANNIFVNSGSCILSQQSEGHGDNAAAAGLEEIKTDVKSKNRRKRYKKRKHISADTVINNSVDKVETCLRMEENKGDGDHAGADGLPDIGTKVVSLKKKRRSKRRKLSERDGVPNCSVPNSSFEKLESCDGLPNNSVQKSECCVLREKQKGDGDCKGADGLQEMKAQVKSRKSEEDVPNYSVEKLGSRNGLLNNSVEKLERCDGLPNDSAEKSESCIHREQQKGDGDHEGADGLQGIKTEGRSRKKERRAKKRKQSESNFALNIISENSVLVGQSECNDSHAGTDELQEIRSEVLSGERKQRSRKRKEKGMVSPIRVLTN